MTTTLRGNFHFHFLVEQLRQTLSLRKETINQTGDKCPKFATFQACSKMVNGVGRRRSTVFLLKGKTRVLIVTRVVRWHFQRWYVACMAKGHVSHYARTFFSIVSPVTRMHVAILEIDVNESLLALSLSLSFFSFCASCIFVAR